MLLKIQYVIIFIHIIKCIQNSCKSFQLDEKNKYIVRIDKSSTLIITSIDEPKIALNQILNYTFASNLYLDIPNNKLYAQIVGQQSYFYLLISSYPDIDNYQSHIIIEMPDIKELPLYSFYPYIHQQNSIFFLAYNYKTQKNVWVITGSSGYQTLESIHCNINYNDDKTSINYLAYSDKNNNLKLVKEKGIISCVGYKNKTSSQVRILKKEKNFTLDFDSGVKFILIKDFSLFYSCIRCLNGFDFQNNILIIPKISDIQITSSSQVYINLDTSNIICEKNISNSLIIPIVTFSGKFYFEFVLKFSTIEKVRKAIHYIKRYESNQIIQALCKEIQGVSSLEVPFSSTDLHKIPIGIANNQNSINYIYDDYFYFFNAKSSGKLSLVSIADPKNIIYDAKQFISYENGLKGVCCQSNEAPYSLEFYNDQIHDSDIQSNNYQWYYILAMSGTIFIILIIMIILFLKYRKGQHQIYQMEQRLIEQNEIQPSLLIDKQYIDQFNGLVNKNIRSFSQVELQIKRKELTNQQFQEQFKKIKQIGKGGFASVWEYENKRTGQRVAVKIILCNDQFDLEEKKQELIILEFAQKRNVVEIYNYVIHQDQNDVTQLIFVMEKADCTLQDLLIYHKENKIPMSEKFLLKFTLEMVTTLSELQEKEQIAHRDLKPSNILIFDNKTNFKLSDFGCSKKYTISNYTKSRTVTGSPLYFSPQLIKYLEKQTNKGNQINQSQSDLDFYKSDVFSFGLTLLASITLKGIVNLNQNKVLLENRIKEYKPRNDFSKLLHYTVKKMLIWDEGKRPSFNMIKIFILHHIKTQIKDQFDQNNEIDEFIQ